jgi:hypothetical protein
MVFAVCELKFLQSAFKSLRLGKRWLLNLVRVSHLFVFAYLMAPPTFFLGPQKPCVTSLWGATPSGSHTLGRVHVVNLNLLFPDVWSFVLAWNKSHSCFRIIIFLFYVYKFSAASFWTTKQKQVKVKSKNSVIESVLGFKPVFSHHYKTGKSDSY